MQPAFDCVWIRWERGIVVVPETAGGREKYVEVKGITRRDDAIALGNSLLSAAIASRSTTAVTGHATTSAQLPGSGFYLAGSLGGQRVQSISVSSDAEGYAVVTPELGDAYADKMAEIERRIARINAGTTSEWASPFTGEYSRGQAIDTSVPVFSHQFQETDTG